MLTGMTPDEEAIAQAIIAQEGRATFIQGFKYGDTHVIRDTFLAMGQQELFRTKDRAVYEAVFPVYKMLPAARALLNLGWARTTPPDRPEEGGGG